jgi:uncharacterized membrane protein YqjE
MEVESIMNDHAEMNHSTRSLASIAAELKQEIAEFIYTRVAMFNSELRDKVAHWKLAAPPGALGIVLLATAYLLVTLSLVALAAVFIKSDYRWFFAFLSVGILWGILGAMSVYIAKREFELSKLVPQKTIEVLKGDKVWLQKEARNQV